MIVTEYMENGALDRYLKVSHNTYYVSVWNMSTITISAVTSHNTCKLENVSTVYLDGGICFIR